MQIFQVTVGWFEDRVTVGFAVSTDQADTMVARARLSSEFIDIETYGAAREGTYRVTGPFELGALYDGLGDLINS